MSDRVFVDTYILVYSSLNDELTKHSQNEPRLHALGRTNEGRVLHITFTLRNAEENIRVISARDMHRKKRTIYEQAT